MFGSSCFAKALEIATLSFYPGKQERPNIYWNTQFFTNNDAQFLQQAADSNSKKTSKN